MALQLCVYVFELTFVHNELIKQILFDKNQV